MNFARRLLIASMVLVAGCATGPTFTEATKSLAPPAAGNGRVYFYRESLAGGAWKPEIQANSIAIGPSLAGSYYFRDLPAGKYKIGTTMDHDEKVELTLNAGETRFVRTSFVFFKFQVRPAVVAQEQAVEEMKGLSFEK